MTTTTSTRASAAMMGMAFGVSMMILFGAAWLAWGFQSMRTDSPWLIAAVTLGGIALLVPCFSIFQIGSKAGKKSAPLTYEEKRIQREMGKMFGIIFGAEGLAIFLTVSALNHFQLESYISTAIAAIVGLHFLPLARLYRFSLYYAIGGVMLLESLIFLTLPSPMREIAVELSMGATLWLTCILVLREGFLLARSFEQA